ncbi:NAD-dependent epimerase/dehydratase family protein [Kutzneria chonburiensis]|uniref:NAD-dependent epimerase/dehydratase family protein n=1 Tax=Kutzneria chonburiensis TaxID=1483604 RepID=A0ABV6MS05_9PSEU|nr:NAD-dependent epimerase/dehydratase family protein [Kutzneria chonburiensis]
MSTNASPLVLVTGGTGYVAAHAIAQLLDAGYRVRTTVRSPKADLPDVEVVQADLSADDGWAAAHHGVQYVLHTASPFPPGSPKHDDDVIAPAVGGTLRVLAAARAAGVERVVLTSSFAAVGYGAIPQSRYTEDDWTDPGDPNTAYIRSKAIAERAAWDDVAAHGGPELSVINPVGIFGPPLNSRVNSSVGIVKAMLDGQMPFALPTRFGVVDVRDVADLHLRAMTSPAAAGRRYLAVSGETISFLDLATMLRDHFGDAAANVPTVELTEAEVRANPALRDALTQLGRRPVISADRARTELGWQPRPVRTTIVETAEALLKAHNEAWT